MIKTEVQLPPGSSYESFGMQTLSIYPPNNSAQMEVKPDCKDDKLLTAIKMEQLQPQAHTAYDQFSMQMLPQYPSHGPAQMGPKPMFKEEKPYAGGSEQKSNDVYVIRQHCSQQPMVDTKYSLMSTPSMTTIKYCSSNTTYTSHAMDRPAFPAPVSQANPHTSGAACTKISADEKVKISAPETTKKSGARRPEKPSVSYINMIGQAIRESPNRKLTLSEIYNYLQNK